VLNVVHGSAQQIPETIVADQALSPSGPTVATFTWTSIFNNEAELLEKDSRHQRWAESMVGGAGNLRRGTETSVVYTDAGGMRFGKGVGIPHAPPAEPQFPVTLAVTWSSQRCLAASPRFAGRGLDGRPETYRCVQCGTAWAPGGNLEVSFCPNESCMFSRDWA